MRLIDADDLKQKVIDYQGGAVDKTVAKRLIEQMPTIEPPAKCITEVHADKEMVAKWINEALQNGIVHCEDCKNWDTDWQSSCGSGHYCCMIDLATAEDFYCKHGRRSDGEEIH